jgi:hypothetical protein
MSYIQLQSLHSSSNSYKLSDSSRAFIDDNLSGKNPINYKIVNSYSGKFKSFYELNLQFQEKIPDYINEWFVTDKKISSQLEQGINNPDFPIFIFAIYDIPENKDKYFITIEKTVNKFYSFKNLFGFGTPTYTKSWVYNICIIN